MKKIITLFLVSLVTTTLMAAPQGRVLKTDKVLNKTELKRLPVKKRQFYMQQSTRSCHI